jgi:hypothetical protein
MIAQFYVDFVFLVIIAISAIITPQDSKHKHINDTLASKFAICIGISMMIVAAYNAGLVDGGIWIDITRASLSLIFAYLFYKAGSDYLTFLCIVIAGFHLTYTYADFDYFSIMVGFQVCQLIVAIWGASDGICDRLYDRLLSVPSWFNTHFHHHT